MAELTFELNEESGYYEAEATLSAGRFAVHIEYEIEEVERTREVEVEVDVLDPETNEPTGETTTETQTQTYTVEVDHSVDNFITIGRSVTGENYLTAYETPYNAYTFDQTFDGLVSGMSVIVRSKNKPTSGVIL